MKAVLRNARDRPKTTKGSTAAGVGVHSHAAGHHLSPPSGGGGRRDGILLLRVRAPHPPRRPPHSAPFLRPRLRALPPAATALCAAGHPSSGNICCLSPCRFRGFLPVGKGWRKGHTLHTGATRIFFFVVFDELLQMSAGIVCVLRA